jgi:hypothetical protein
MSWLQIGKFTSHAGLTLDWKIECDDLTSEEIETFALLIYRMMPPFSKVIGIPRGGLRLAEAIGTPDRLDTRWKRLLIVDDVFTTGQSMERARLTAVDNGFNFNEIMGAVMFARAVTPQWIRPIFQLNTDAIFKLHK